MSIPVHRPADAPRSGPLTWGQLWPWLDACRPPEAREFHAPYLWCLVPAGLDLAGVRRAILTVLRRCESLRTSFHIGPNGEPYQRVEDVDAVAIRFLEITGADNAYDTGERFRAEALRGMDVRRCPTAIAVLTDGLRPAQVVCVMNHVAVDGWSTDLVRDMLSRAMADELRADERSASDPSADSSGTAALGTAAPGSDPQGRGAPAEDRPVAELPADPQPLDDVAIQTSPAGQRRDDRAHARRAQHRRELPHTLFPESQPGERARPATRAELNSRAVALAAQFLSRRHRVPLASIYLGAYAAVLWAHTGITSVGVDTSSANRSTAARQRLVSSVVLPALAVIQVNPAASFADLLGRAATASLEALAYSEGDHTRRMITDVVGCHERGVHFYCSPELNVVLAGEEADPTQLRPATIHQAAARTRGRVARISWYDRLRMEVNVQRGQANLELWTSDGVMGPEAALALLQDVEKLLLVASDTDLPLARVAQSLAGQPPVRGPEWQRIDNCWVRPDDLRRLLASHPEVAASTVVVADDRLRAYLVPRNGSLDPARVHRWLVTAVSRLPSAMAAHWYVVCANAPDEVADPAAQDQATEAAWRSVPVLVEGDGRGPVLQPIRPETPAQLALLAAVRQTGCSGAHLDDCYPVAGGVLRRVPAILDILAEAGWQGLTYHDLNSSRILAELAEMLHPVPDRDSLVPVPSASVVWEE